MVDKNNFILVFADFESGIILNKDGSYYTNDGEDYYVIVEGKEKAITTAKDIVERKNLEILMYNSKGILINKFN